MPATFLCSYALYLAERNSFSLLGWVKEGIFSVGMEIDLPRPGQPPYVAEISNLSILHGPPPKEGEGPRMGIEIKFKDLSELELLRGLQLDGLLLTIRATAEDA